MVEIPYGKRMRPRYWRFLIITAVGVALVAFALDIPWLLITLLVLGVLNTVVCVGALYVLHRQPHTVTNRELRQTEVPFQPAPHSAVSSRAGPHRPFAHCRAPDRFDASLRQLTRRR